MKARIIVGFTALLAAAATTASMQVPGASAAGRPTAGAGRIQLASHRAAHRSAADRGLSAKVAASWQTNGTVWALAVVKGVVYVGGDFTSVRPPGDSPGHGTVARSYLAAFKASTGRLLSFHPRLSGEVTALAVSPNRKTLYVGGTFSQVGRSGRENLAAFRTSSGALKTWAPTATGGVLSIAPSPDGSTIYVGGNFTKLDGQARTRAGAVAGSGALLPWAPDVNGTVTSVAVAPNDSRVLVGGYFTTFNGVTQQAIGSTNPATGASEPFAATILPNVPGCFSDVKDIIISGRIAYIAAEGTGGGCFDGDFAARVRRGALIWQNDCLGATQALAILNGVLYKGSHAHDCAYAPGGFPQVAAPSGVGWVTHHLLDQSLTNGTLGHWNPKTSGNPLGPRVMATDGTRLFVGGDFMSVNGRLQQGFARFGPGPDRTRPGRPAAPTVTSTSRGVDSVTFNAVSTPDVGTLTYAIYRDGRKTAIGRVSATSWPWALPVLHYRDAGLRPRSRHTYRVTVSDGTRVSVKSLASARITVSAKNPPHGYRQTVLLGKPSFFWRLDEKTGGTAADSSPNHFSGIYEPGTKRGVPGPITGVNAAATAFNGVSGLVTSASQVTSPQTFSIEGWFKTTTATGGKLMGFGSSQTGLSSSYDRQIYMMNDGQLVFGVRTGQMETIETPNVYNDGQWHYVVATFDSTVGSDNMALYVDGRLISTETAGAAQSYSGYWRVGGDNLDGWNLDPWGKNSQGTTEPSRYYFRGSIGDVAVYPYALSATRVRAHYAANSRSH
jgi:hypothetical protein